MRFALIGLSFLFFQLFSFNSQAAEDVRYSFWNRDAKCGAQVIFPEAGVKIVVYADGDTGTFHGRPSVMSGPEVRVRIKKSLVNTFYVETWMDNKSTETFGVRKTTDTERKLNIKSPFWKGTFCSSMIRVTKEEFDELRKQK